MRVVTPFLIRNFVFGVEDGLVSTAGLLTGIATAAVPRPTILLTGITLIFVEAFSMAVGSFLSEQSVEDFRMRKKHHAHSSRSFFGASVMFASYLASGMIPLFPYIFFEREQAIPISVVVSLAALFFFGIAGGSFSRAHVFSSGFRMFGIGGGAMLIGIAAGFFFRV